MGYRLVLTTISLLPWRAQSPGQSKMEHFAHTTGPSILLEEQTVIASGIIPINQPRPVRSACAKVQQSCLREDRQVLECDTDIFSFPADIWADSSILHKRKTKCLSYSKTIQKKYVGEIVVESSYCVYVTCKINIECLFITPLAPRKPFYSVILLRGIQLIYIRNTKLLRLVR